MTHGDDDGLVLPPRVAPVECRIIPIAQHKEGVLDRAYALLDELKKAGYRVKIDDSEKSPGWKFSEQEILGIPTRIEIGPKDIENNQVIVCRRDTREKITVSLDNIAVELRNILETVQADMLAKAEEFLNAHIDTAVTMEASFIDDLGADSLDIVELVMALEEEFDMEIPDSDAEKVVTVGDVVEYIKENVQ